MIAWTLLIACNGGATDVDSDSATGAVAPVYPKGDRILIYTGHSGEDGANNGGGQFDDAGSWIKDTYGWNTSVRTDLSDPTQYRVIVLMDSGIKGTSVYGDATVALLQEALAAGVRVVSTVSRENCAGETLNPLFEALGLLARYGGEGANAATVTTSTPALNHQLTDGVSEVRFLESCWVASNGATVILADERDVVGTVEQVGDGGEVVVLGDYSWFDDRGYLDKSDNRLFLGNMVEVDPDLGPLPTGTETE